MFVETILKNMFKWEESKKDWHRKKHKIVVWSAFIWIQSFSGVWWCFLHHTIRYWKTAFANKNSIHVMPDWRFSISQ